MSNLNLDEVEMTLVEENIALYEENQNGLAELILQEVPFYSFIKAEAVEELDTSADSQVANLLQYELAGADITDIVHEETCCSYDSCNTEIVCSPDSDDTASLLSPENRNKCDSGRKNRTPNTLRHMMEKHRHSERKRHHSLNERLKAICEVVPGSAQDNRETKVVMMQRVISYIAYLENTVKLLCAQIGTLPEPSWASLTSNFVSYLKDYFKGTDDCDADDDDDDDEVVAATENLAKSMKTSMASCADMRARHLAELPSGPLCFGLEVPESQEEESDANSYCKVSSPTVDSTTDSVVPDVGPVAQEEIVITSQDSGVPSSSQAEDEDHTTQLWDMYSTYQKSPGVGGTYGDAGVFFSSAVDDGVSAVLEISSSSINDDNTVALGFDAGYIKGSASPKRKGRNKQPVVARLQSAHQSLMQETSIHNFYTIQRHVPKIPRQQAPEGLRRRNKRKQLSPRRSAFEDDYPSDRAYLPSLPTARCQTGTLCAEHGGSHKKVHVLPYNIRCNHRHPVQRLQESGCKTGFQRASPVIKSLPEATRIPAASKTEDKLGTKLDLRKTSWMNGFMMFSRLNRRRFIQAHPGVHTSHISKIMGHAWRNMSKEEQAPYKEKAKACAKELYRVFTSQPEFTLCSASAASPASTANPVPNKSLFDISQPAKVE